VSNLEWNATGEDFGTLGSIVSAIYYFVGDDDDIVETTK
jgi:hypothetical protein